MSTFSPCNNTTELKRKIKELAIIEKKRMDHFAYEESDKLSKAFEYIISENDQIVNVLKLARKVNVDPEFLETYLDYITEDNGYIDLIKFHPVEELDPEDYEIIDPDLPKEEFEDKMYNYDIVVNFDLDNIEDQLRRYL